MFLATLPMLLIGQATAGGRFSCDVAEEVVDENLGELNGRPLRARLCTSPDAADGHQVLVRVQWEAPVDEDVAWQTLKEGTAAASAGAYAIVLDGASLTLSYGSGASFDPLGQLTRDTWRWDPGTRQFVDHQSVTSSAWVDGLAAVDSALAAGDLAAARTSMAAMGATPNGGHTWYDDPFFLKILTAASAEARRLHRLGRAEEAADLVVDLLRDPPVTSPDAEPKSGELLFCRDLSASCAGLGTFNDLPLDVPTANLAVALAFFLARGGQDAAAISLFEQVITLFPTSAEVHLSLADALWDVGRPDEAKTHYQQYIELKPDKKLSRKQRRRLAG